MRRFFTLVCVIGAGFALLSFGVPGLKHLDLAPPKAHASTFSMQTGYYIGTGTTLNVTGLHFKPDFVMITADNTTVTSLFKTSAMPAENVAYFSASSDNRSGHVTFTDDGFSVGEPVKVSLDADGFSVNNRANLAIENVRYNWVAFTGSDCSASGSFCVGTYTGDANNTQTITTGFQPAVVIVKRSTAVAAHFHTASEPDNESQFFYSTAANTTGAYIQTLNSTGFTVGSSDDVQGGVYYYIAFKNVPGSMSEGTYTGDGTDDRAISGVGFQPDFVVVKNGVGAYSPVFNTTQSYGDSSSFFTSTASAANRIEALQSDGFEVGTTAEVNQAGTPMYWFAFSGAAPPSASGTFSMDEGSYTGNGTGQNISGLSFAPDLIIVKDESSNQSVFRTRLMGGNSSAYLAGKTANLSDGGIESLNSAGFSIGPSAVVNTSGHTYHWEAFGNAFNPMTNTGASDFAIGAYTGNGVDDRTVNSLPFQPDMVTVKSFTKVGYAVWRPSSYSYDSSLYFYNNASTTNDIESLNTDGFTVGTDAAVNTNAILYFWFAFKDGPHFTVGSYTGDGTDNRDVTGVGFASDFLWLKAATAQYAVARGASLSGDSSQYFYSAANASNLIQSLESDGFQVGNSAIVNGNNTPYFYAAWLKTAPPSGTPGTPGAPTFSGTTVTATTLAWSSASGASYYEIERAKNFANFLIYEQIATTTSTSYTDAGLEADSAYVYRVRAVNSAGAVGSFSSESTLTTDAQSYHMQTGYYVGNGGDISITGLGFSPEFVIIKSDTSASAAVFVTTGMQRSTLASLYTGADNAVANINTEGVRYTWIAFSGSDCSASGVMCIGSYTGDANTTQDISTGFKPDFVLVKNVAAVGANFRTSSEPDNESQLFYNAVANTTGAYIRTLNPAGFTVGPSDNSQSSIYYYVAFKDTAGRFAQGSYTANNVDGRSITGVGFAPAAVIVKNGDTVTSTNAYAQMNVTDSDGDNSSYFSATANKTNTIQSLDSDGFTVGNDMLTNGSGSNTQYWIAFGADTASVPSGTFTMQEGTYTGNGTSQSISGLGFAPDLVFIKDSSSANYPVFRTSVMGGNTSAYLSGATANVDGAIMSLDTDGFTVGGGPTVNTSGDTYDWQAFGNAYNPYTRTGASDFAVGAYYGSGQDSRPIAGAPQTPDLVAVKSVSTGYAVWRPSTITYDSSLYFYATASSSNMIESLLPSGFQVGTSANVNTAALVYYWFSFKGGSNFTVNSYVGDGTDDRDISGVGFQPDLLWVKAATAQYGAFRTATLSGDISHIFKNVVDVVNAIQAFITDGFDLGTSGYVNGSGIPYYYAAWKVPSAGVVSVSISDGVVDYGALGPGAVVDTTSGGLNDTQGVVNDGTYTEDFSIKGQDTACPWTLSGAPGTDQYAQAFSTNSGGSWTPLTTTYQPLKSTVAIHAATPLDLQLSAPTASSCGTVQNADVTVLATQH